MNIKEYKVDIDNISVNPKYQRPLNETWVRKLVKNYDDAKVNQLILSATPEGKYYVVDGQHTVEATRRVKGEHVLLPAKVFFGLTEKEEADLFYTYNTDRKALSSNDKIRARLVRGEADVVDYFDALDYTGINYSLTPSTTQLCNHSTCVKVFSAVQRKSALLGMSCFLDSGYKNESLILSGMMFFFDRQPEADETRLSKKLRKISADEIRRTSFDVGVGAGYSVTSSLHGSISTSRQVPTSIRIMAKTIAYFYNKGLQNKIDLATI